MERAWLEAQLAAGRSIEAIAREVSGSPSTVAYWVHKHGLRSSHAERHAARGAIAREVLEPLVAGGASIREIAARLDRSHATIRHWLRRYGLRTRPASDPLPDGSVAAALVRRCGRHGWTAFALSPSGRYRCKRCRTEAVSARRRRVKAILVREAGGCCRLCGYARHVGALQFHHVDPRGKRFSLAGGGLARSLASARVEAARCILLCANCHAEVEAGVATIPQAVPTGTVS